MPLSGVPENVDVTYGQAFGQIVACLVNSNVFTSSNCFVSNDENFYPKAGGVYGTVMLSTFSDVESASSGAGRYCSEENLEFNVRIYMRTYTDKIQEDAVSLLSEDNTNSVLAKARDVKRSLQCYYPQGEDGNDLLIFAEPVRFRYIGTVHRHPRSSEWIICDVNFIVPIVFDYENQ